MPCLDDLVRWWCTHSVVDRTRTKPP
jgi:hypothetical protein